MEEDGMEEMERKMEGTERKEMEGMENTAILIPIDFRSMSWRNFVQHKKKPKESETNRTERTKSMFLHRLYFVNLRPV